ncbi:hypothetical protein [Colwellia psychrerythraea]|uniref:Uncharacterized protein n=1 Tax=Colwellia psychrerythraea TaxID=28229 RepID=A0A099KVX6_COLPS|nr:hypothetical protein [Colwellia psychrerythraea]KGJ94007.1 hypothetical protein GAB14E_2562 [Colwellia psychrerythraea]
MHINLNIFTHFSEYLFPNTKTQAGYKISLWGGVFIAAFFWLFSIINFSKVGMHSYDLEGFIRLIQNYGTGFYILFSAFFWMVLTFSFHDFPKSSGIIALIYVLLATVFDGLIPNLNLYFYYINNIFFTIIVILLTNPIIAAFRVQSVSEI